jgi:peptidoglycan/xylan/chitin deacetylase (PgdA/CDA1 family)
VTPASDTIVLCYHAISSTWDAELSITPAHFTHQVRTLLDRGYEPVRFSDAVRNHGRGRRLAVTFDDAYRSVIDLALPILQQWDAPATVFAPTDFIGREAPMSWPGIEQWLITPSRDELMPMTWDELGKLRAADWEIGSHTASHPHLTTLDDASLKHELRRSKQVCEEHLGAGCVSLAYPYGDVDPRVVRAAEDAGYDTAALLSSRFAAALPLEWPRVGIYRVDDARRFALKVSPAMRRLQGSVLWDALDAAGARARRR